MGIINYKIITRSNLFIGGAPQPFEIGGLDQYTVTDQKGYPYIPASSMKGILRTIVRESGEKAEEISNWYFNYLERTKEQYKNWIAEMENPISEEVAKRFETRYKNAVRDKSNMLEYLFGIEGFNNTPRLFFQDILLSEDSKEKNIFSIDMKNSITTNDKRPVSNPRTYKTAASGLTFEGTIRLYKFDELNEKAEEKCICFIKKCLGKFNDGIYRLGNSKSRGYGRIEVEFAEL